MSYVAPQGKPMSVERFLAKFGYAALTVRPTDSVVNAAGRFSEPVDGRRQSLAVVIDDGDRVVGVLSLGDIAHALSHFRDAVLDMTVADVMTRNVSAAQMSDNVLDLLKRMADKNIRHMPVVEDGVLKGLVTRKDALEGLYDDTTFQLKYLTEYVFRSGARY